jgi:hypothetical protein
LSIAFTLSVIFFNLFTNSSTPSADEHHANGVDFPCFRARLCAPDAGLFGAVELQGQIAEIVQRTIESKEKSSCLGTFQTIIRSVQQ